jgi:hypothetical protein
MSLDLLDKLISDLVTVTESLIDIEDSFDISTWEPFPKKESSTKSKHEKDHPKSENKGKGKEHHEIKDGVYRSVC